MASTGRLGLPRSDRAGARARLQNLEVADVAWTLPHAAACAPLCGRRFWINSLRREQAHPPASRHDVRPIRSAAHADGGARPRTRPSCPLMCPLAPFALSRVLGVAWMDGVLRVSGRRGDRRRADDVDRHRVAGDARLGIALPAGAPERRGVVDERRAWVGHLRAAADGIQPRRTVHRL
jgi:hypothetical protein